MAGNLNSTLHQLTQIGGGSHWIRVAAEGVGYFGDRNGYCTYALKSDGTLWVWDGDLRRPVNKHVQKIQSWLLKLGISATWLTPKLQRPVQLLGPELK